MTGNFLRSGDFEEKDQRVLLYGGIRRSMITAGGLQIVLSLVQLVSAIILLETPISPEKDFLEVAASPAGHVLVYVTVQMMLLTGCVGVVCGLLCRMITSLHMVPHQIQRAKTSAKVYMGFLAAVALAAGVTIGLTAAVSLRAHDDGVPRHFPFSSAMIIVLAAMDVVLALVPLGALYNYLTALATLA